MASYSSGGGGSIQKKRGFGIPVSPSDVVAIGGSAGSSGKSSSNKRIRLIRSSNSGTGGGGGSSSNTFLQLNLDRLRAELDHERSLRSLDNKRSLQEKQRLERQMEFAMEEADLAKALLEELRQTSEEHIETLREQLQQCQEQQLAAVAANNDNHDENTSNDNSNAQMWKRKCALLEEECNSRNEHEMILQEQLTSLKESIENNTINTNHPGGATPSATATTATAGDEQQHPLSPSSPAPTAVMKELNRVRIQLAETERKQRQLTRQNESYHQSIIKYQKEQEMSKSNAARIQKLEYELHTTHQQKQTLFAKNQQWASFGQQLHTLLLSPAQTKNKQKNNNTPKENDHGIPPEFSTLKRHLETLHKQIQELQQSKETLEERIDALKSTTTKTTTSTTSATDGETSNNNNTTMTIEQKLKQFNTKEQQWLEQETQYKKKLESIQKDMETMKAQESIWKREADGLRTLLETLDETNQQQQQAQSQSKSLSTTTAATAKGLEIQLKTTGEELELLKEDRSRIQKELQTSTKEYKEKEEELQKVKDKFVKLRDALYKEKEKAQEAEARAIRAEELAGKGSFNPETTKVVHMKQNPLTDAFKEEIKVLKRKIELLLSKQNSSNSSIQSPNSTTLADTSINADLDPDKLHQRLKQSFKEQIAIFREGVHLMTGYKIDMIPNDDNRPTFRVRSMFAEQEQDHLLLKWPKPAKKTSSMFDVTSLDILNSEFAQQLTKQPFLYDYMTKYHSLPAFLSSVQLNLFEKQTLMA